MSFILVPILLVVLFFAVFGTVFGIRQCVEKDALWALLLALVCGLVSIQFYVLTAGRIGFLSATMFVLLPIMRFGMEQIDETRPKSGRDSFLRKPLVSKLFTKLETAAQNPHDTSLQSRFLAMKITEVPVFGPVAAKLAAIYARIGAAGAARPDASGTVAGKAKALMEARRHPVVVWFYRLCVLLFLILAVAKCVYVLSGRDLRDRMVAEIGKVVNLEHELAWVKGKYLGDYLSKKHPNSSVLLISKPVWAAAREAHRCFIAGLTEGFAGKLRIVAEEELPALDSDDRRAFLAGRRPTGDQPRLPGPLQAMQDSRGKSGMKEELKGYCAELMDGMLEEHSDCDVVIATCGLPGDFPEMSFWEESEVDRPKLVLMNVELANLLEPLKQGFVTAAVISKSDAKPPQNVNLRESYASVFRKLFILADAENLPQTQSKPAEQTP